MLRVATLAAAAALLTVPSFAQDLTPDTSRILSDPNYLPLAGQIYGYTDYTHDWTNGSTYNYLGDQVSSFRVNTDSLAQFLSYGITDDLEINGSFHYVPDSDRQVALANGTARDLNSSGFSDPSFGAAWRAIDQGPYPVNLDFFGSYTPDWISSQAASIDEDGNVARGGDSGTVGAALGYETRQFSMRGAFNAVFYGPSQTFDLGSGDTVATQGHTDYVLSLATQTRLNPLFSVNAGVDHTFAADHGAYNETTGISHLSQPGDSTALHAALNYNIVPDTAVIAATYTHNFLGDNHAVYLDPTSDTSTRNKSGDVVGVQLSYVLP